MTIANVKWIRKDEPNADGLLLPGFIKNGDTRFFTEFGVYANGIFECWCGVDRDFLKQKIDCGWIASQVPETATISVHALMRGTIENATWEHDQQSLHERFLGLLQTLNPELKQLADFEGSDVEVQENGVRHSKVGFVRPSANRPSSKRDWKMEMQNALVKHGDDVFLTPLRIYEDGMIDVHPLWGREKLVDLDEFQSLVDSNEILFRVPNGTTLHIDTVGRFEVHGFRSAIHSESDFLNSVSDTIAKMQGAKSLIEKCRDAHAQYDATPTVANRAVLKDAYEAIPRHERMYVGDMDVKDIPVRMIIYGDQEIENWSHRAVARANGEEDLPSIRVRRPELE